jgi:hypothetical protein
LVQVFPAPYSHRPSVFLHSCHRQRFTFIQNHRLCYSFLYSIFSSVQTADEKTKSSGLSSNKHYLNSVSY